MPLIDIVRMDLDGPEPAVTVTPQRAWASSARAAAARLHAARRARDGRPDRGWPGRRHRDRVVLAPAASSGSPWPQAVPGRRHGARGLETEHADLFAIRGRTARSGCCSRRRSRCAAAARTCGSVPRRSRRAAALAHFGALSCAPEFVEGLVYSDAEVVVMSGEGAAGAGGGHAQHALVVVQAVVLQARADAARRRRGGRDGRRRGQPDGRRVRAARTLPPPHARCSGRWS